MNIGYPKRLIEVDLPIKRVSAHARLEKSIRHGHISMLRIWRSSRSLAVCGGLRRHFAELCLNWKPTVKVEHYVRNPQSLLSAEEVSA
jgi:hypothetical protein